MLPLMMLVLCPRERKMVGTVKIRSKEGRYICRPGGGGGV